ncbi:unnamed protein product [Kuraishia capsulata CBS 1993]|uniref:Major facilitator superfamily (MFS) profile domain-containing protein n=1 Tax=Kuraishia capsulata CBS 1993 TaxID=1382522 RepID=W6MH87_9ASCO|nr:uncharacterized protein KUCA_T00001549001 [Kuraishia capsulata CBS 1993]CDK25579.1 unnamed protein product [Kuraishia capsulata CBS 1993]
MSSDKMENETKVGSKDSSMTLSSLGREETVALPSNTSSSSDLERLAIEAQLENDNSNSYSVYSTAEIYCIVLLSSFAGMFSTISSPIYLPVLPVLRDYFGTTEEHMNLTVVVYSIFQGLSPSVFSNLADRYGRRIIIMMCLLMYMLVNIGIACNNSYAGLMVLRCLQAAGIASTLSVSSGIVCDLTVESERGLYMGITTGVTLTGQAIGAIIGGLIQNSLGWRAIFWFLAIASGSTLVLIAMLLPETNRAIVGNGSTLPNTWRVVAIPPVLLLPCWKNRRLQPGLENNTITPIKEFDIIAPLRIMKCIEVLLVLAPASTVYAGWLMMLTSLSTSLQDDYGYSTIHASILYIPSGVAGITGSILGGELLNWNYRRSFEHYADCVCGYTRCPKPFNFLKARIPFLFGTVILAMAGLIMFGWCIDKKVNVTAVMVASFLVAFGAMSAMSVASTLLVDMFPKSPSAAVACLNLTRCLSAAVGLAILSLSNAQVGVGGTYSWLSGLVTASSFCAIIAYVYSEKFWFSGHTEQA